jgi:hypothetical protein
MGAFEAIGSSLRIPKKAAVPCGKMMPESSMAQPKQIQAMGYLARLAAW